MERDPQAVDPLQSIQLLEENDHFTYVSSLLTSKEAKAFEGVLQHNKDVFTWTPSDMPKIYPSITSHRLNVIPSS